MLSCITPLFIINRPFLDLAPQSSSAHTLVRLSPIDSVIKTINEMSNIFDPYQGFGEGQA